LGLAISPGSSTGWVERSGWKVSPTGQHFSLHDALPIAEDFIQKYAPLGAEALRGLPVLVVDDNATIAAYSRDALAGR